MRRKSAKKAIRKIVKKAIKAIKKRAENRPRSPKKIIRKVFLPPQHAPVQSTASSAMADHRLPAYYGEDKLVLLVRDPWWLFAYWEVTQTRHEEVVREVQRAGHREWKTILRVYDVTQASLAKSRSFFDIELNFYTDNWYIDVGLPDREWMAEIGLRAGDGRFFVLVSSNKVRTPAFGISDVLDEEWMLPESVYYRLIGLSGVNAQQGSMDIRKILEKYLKRFISSERLPQVSRK